MSKRAVQIRAVIFILLLILALLLTFRFGYLDAGMYIKALDAENLKLRGEIIELNRYIERQKEYEDQLWEINQNKDALMEKYRANVRPEKLSLFMHEIGERTGAEVDDIIFAEKILINSETEKVVKADKSNSEELVFYKTPVIINLKADYKQLKGVIAMLQSSAEKMNIKSVKANLGNDGKFNITIVLNVYAIRGMKKDSSDDE